MKAARWAAALFFMAVARPASAQIPDLAPVDDYRVGRELLEANKPAEALPHLEESFRARPSPNTELLVAHALRELDRKVEAEEHYGNVISSAKARIAAGEARYEPTLVDANHWFTVLRASLCELSIVIERAPSQASIVVDDNKVKTDFDALQSTMKAKTWHLPGHASIAVLTPDGAIEHASADLVAGGASEVRLVLVHEKSAVSPPDSIALETPRSLRPPTASLVSAGVAAIALGTFIGFGVDANAAANELKACSSSRAGCPAAKFQPVADRGSRSAAVANVSIAVAGAGLVTAAAIWIIAAKRRDPRTGFATPEAAAAFHF